ncbi:polygalacturonase-like protein [Tanacetum coccineum]
MINSPMVVEGAVVPRRLINVVRLGAIPDGQTDASVPFQSAWASACSSFTPSTIYLPAGRFFVRSAYFQGDRCKNKAIRFVINETLLTPSDFRNLVWIKFEKVTGVSILDVVLDGRGTALWACKARSGRCPADVKFFDSKNIMITRLTSINSQKFHIVINACQNVNLQGITVSAPGN